MSRAGLLLATLVLATLAGCGGARPPADGRASGYAPGVPDFDLDARVLTAETPIEVEALVSIPRSSLVFTRDDDGFRTIIRTAFRISDREDTPLAAPARADTLRVATYAETVSFVPFVVRQRLPGLPGDLILQAEVEDTRTGRTALRRLSLTIPAPKESMALSAPSLAGRLQGETSFRPLLSIGVPASLDSLQFRLDVFGARGPLTVEAELVRLRADSTVAEPPSVFSPTPASLRARGVDIGTAEMLFESVQRLPSPDHRLTVESALPPLAPGVYTLRLSADDESGEPVQSERTFVVRPPSFPRLQGVADLIEPLAYIATDREMRLLRETVADSQRYAFDAFWGGLFRDRRQAAATLRTYFERVEEANRRFSTYTDGWKTDRGMIYIVFGPPERVEERFDREVWTYSGASGGLYSFERTARRTQGKAPFDVWTLDRDRAYDASWRRGIRLWRSGQPP